jgi:coatomer subunit beta
VKFPDVAGSVVHLLMDFLGDANTASALDVVFFVREIIETNAKLREGIMARLLDCFYQIRSSRVCACALWIIGEYSADLPTIEASLAVLKASLGAVPFYTREQEEERAIEGGKVEAASVSTGSKRPAVLADGTYATQVSVSETAAGGAAVPNLRAVLLTGDFFLGSVVATSLTKLVLRMCVTATPLRMRLTRREGERPLRSNHPRM